MPTPLVIRDVEQHLSKNVDPSVTMGPSVDTPDVPNIIGPLQSSFKKYATTHMGDISTSPRLLGYIFSFISCSVTLTSSIIFYVRGIEDSVSLMTKSHLNTTESVIYQSQLEEFQASFKKMTLHFELFSASGGFLINEWKVYGSIAISGLLAIITLFTIIAHLDSYCFPDKFRQFFQDGSVSERNLILTLITISVISLHTSTSKFSVGEAQANVFISSWTNFISLIMTFEVWRKGAGRNHSFQNILFDRDFPLKRHWFLLCIFASITFLATIDYFLSSNFLVYESEWNCHNISWTNQWIWLSLGLLVLCWGVFFVRQYLKSIEIFLACEMLVSSIAIGISGFVIASFTGGRQDQISCPSNLYFSIWASFFSGVWIFSSLIQNCGKSTGTSGNLLSDR